MAEKQTVYEKNPIKRFLANRVLPPALAQQYEIKAPISFGHIHPYDVGQIGTVGPLGAPPGSGLAYVFSPYTQWYTKLYGVIPIADLTKYRLMYRTQPDVMGRINKRVVLSTGKGFTIECDDPDGDEAAQYLEKWAKDHDLQEILRVVATDMLVYGNAYIELVWDKMADTQIEIDPDAPQESESTLQAPMRAWVEESTLCDTCGEHTFNGIRYVDGYTFYGDKSQFQASKCTNPGCSTFNADEPFKWGTRTGSTLEQIVNYRFLGQDRQQPISPLGQPMVVPKAGERPPTPYKEKPKVSAHGPGPGAKTIENIKYLDPLYMRVRADAYGNVFGYYQWLAWPPVLLSGNSTLHFRWNPQSWGYETMYGTSILMPLIRFWDLRTQLENDLAVWVHTYAKPTVHLVAGSPEQPYTDAQMTQLAKKWANRKPGSDILTKSDVTSTVIETTVGRGNTLTEWMAYLTSRFKEELGVPDALMGQTGAGGSNRSTATVALEDFIVEVEMLQEQLSRPLEQKVFPALLKSAGFDKHEKLDVDENTLETVTSTVDVTTLEYKIVWKPPFEEDPNTRSQRLIDLRKTCVISVNELRGQLPDVGSIDKTDERYKEEMDDPLFPPPAAAKPFGEGSQLGPDGQAPAGELGPTSLTEPGGADSTTGQYKAQRRMMVSSFE